MSAAEEREIYRERQGRAAAARDIKSRSLGWATEHYASKLRYRAGAFTRGYALELGDEVERRVARRAEEIARAEVAAAAACAAYTPDLCTECGEYNNDGEGYDGLCGTCADRAYDAEEADHA